MSGAAVTRAPATAARLGIEAARTTAGAAAVVRARRVIGKRERFPGSFPARLPAGAA